ncbi:MAG: glycoside hydrolase family 140 protein [Candidatus Moduliflexus flocculans]|nr:glycoside hydrolase family 140 protein [Candidatus Moduliflexus flocculans]
MLAAACGVGGEGGATSLYPLKVAPGGRFLIDRQGDPFLIIGDAPQALMVNASVGEAESLLANRASHGFNTVWIMLICNAYSGGRADAGTFDGLKPFTAVNDLSTPNEAYFARCDQIIRAAANRGINVILDPVDTGGFMPVLRQNGLDKCRTLRPLSRGSLQGLRQHHLDVGERLSELAHGIRQRPGQGRRRRYPGNGLPAHPHAPARLLRQQLARQQRLVGPGHAQRRLHVLSGLRGGPRGLQPGPGRPGLPDRVRLRGRERRRRGTAQTPGILVAALRGLRPRLRKRLCLAGHDGLGGQSRYPGRRSVRALPRALFASRPWQTLVPDQAHALVTAGRGTFWSGGTPSSGISQNDYVAAASTPDGKLAIVYIPTSRTITVDLARLSGSVSPRAGTIRRPGPPNRSPALPSRTPAPGPSRLPASTPTERRTGSWSSNRSEPPGPRSLDIPSGCEIRFSPG